MVQSLAAHVGQADPHPAEYLLQKVLLLLAAMHKRSACGKTPVQLHELAEAAFDALRAVNACEVRLNYIVVAWAHHAAHAGDKEHPSAILAWLKSIH